MEQKLSKVEELELENKCLSKRLKHLLQSKLISLFDEVERNTQNYKLAINILDKEFEKINGYYNLAFGEGEKNNKGVNMIKIIDEVNLFVLINSYGFTLRKEDNYLVKKVYLNNADDDKNFYQINPVTRIIELTRLDGELDDTLFELTKDGLVEKVVDNKWIQDIT